ncbi:MAG TPA: twin-arginine translocation signal domain-containing protein [Pirellulaceae bacterium]|nr:twin-arginine translocation signal domain-containing protein [Pirellulaceae bacterium]
MLRRNFLRAATAAAGCAGLGLAGCRGTQYARVIKPGEQAMVGSHAAGQETFTPLIDEAVGQLLARHDHSPYRQVSTGPEPLPPPKLRVCFVGVENCTAEEIGDFKAQIYERIDTRLLQCGTVAPISRRFVDAALVQTRLRPEQLFVPENMRMFVGLLEQQGQPFDYLLFAKLTSGTTRENRDYQRDYDLTLELVDIRTGEQDKQTATLSKGYHHSWTSRTLSQFWPWR